MKRDEYDLTLVNFASLIPILDQFFTYPLHGKQVFFSIDPKEKGWKVVLWKRTLQEMCYRKRFKLTL
jgi:hypothetical protein